MMKAIFKSVAFFAAIVLSTPVFAELTYQQLQDISVSAERVEGTFKQSKFLAEIGVSIDSSGVFSYQRSEKIVWKTLEPVENEMQMTPTTIINRQQGQEIARLDSRENPTIAVFSDIFFSILTAQWSQLADHFDLQGSQENEQWNAKLTPIDSNIKKMISQVELQGDKLLRHIVLHEVQGDKTTITFKYLTQ